MAAGFNLVENVFARVFERSDLLLDGAQRHALGFSGFSSFLLRFDGLAFPSAGHGTHP